MRKIGFRPSVFGFCSRSVQSAHPKGSSFSISEENARCLSFSPNFRVKARSSTVENAALASQHRPRPFGSNVARKILFSDCRQPCFCPNAPSPTVDPPDLAQNLFSRPSIRLLSREIGSLDGRAHHWHAKTLLSTVEKTDFAQNPPVRPSLSRLFQGKYVNSSSFASIPEQNAWEVSALLAAFRVLRLYHEVPFATQLRIPNPQSPITNPQLPIPNYQLPITT